MKFKIWHLAISIVGVAIFLWRRNLWIANEDDSVAFCTSLLFGFIAGAACGWLGVAKGKTLKIASWTGAAISIPFALERVFQLPSTVFIGRQRRVLLDFSDPLVNLLFVLFSSFWSAAFGFAAFVFIVNYKQRIISCRFEITSVAIGALIGSVFAQLLWHALLRNDVDGSRFVYSFTVIFGIVAVTWAANRKKTNQKSD